MQLTPSSLNSIYQGYNTIFKGALNSATLYMSAFATERASGAAIENYAFLARAPKFRRWIGERIWHNLEGYNQQVVNLPYEDGYEIDADHVEDDQIGLFNDPMAQLGEAAGQWMDDLLVAALQAGKNITVYDGQHFFDGSHPINKARPALGTQSNYNQSFPLTATNFETVTNNQSALVGEDGTPLATGCTHLVVPPALKQTGKRIVQAQRDQYGADNVDYQAAELVVVPKLNKEPTVWYTFDLSKAVKPLVRQVRRAPRFYALDQLTMDNVVNLRKLRYGADARGAAGYGLWQLATRNEG